VHETEPTSTRSGFRFGKFCSTKLLCVFLAVVVGLGCSAFALSSYASCGVSSELLESVFVPDAAAIPVSNRTRARRLLAHADSACARVSPQVLDLSNTTPANGFSPTVRGTAFASSAALPTETETARGALFSPFNNPAPVSISFQAQACNELHRGVVEAKIRQGLGLPGDSVTVSCDSASAGRRLSDINLSTYHIVIRSAEMEAIKVRIPRPPTFALCASPKRPSPSGILHEGPLSRVRARRFRHYRRWRAPRQFRRQLRR